MDASIKISIIVPSYNQGKYIENVILSTINQTYQNWELIIQDGSSTDCTTTVCERYCRIDNRIKFSTEKDKGFADAVNKALEKATGELCVIQSSDDFFASKNVFIDVVNIYTTNNNLTLITGAAVTVDEELHGLKIEERVEKYIPFENIYLLKDHFSQGATFFPRQRALDIGKLDPSVDMVADTDFWIRMTCYTPTSVNSTYQTSRIWGGVMLQEEQRSMDLSAFFLGRAKMAALHMNNSNMDFDINWKKKHANSLINDGIKHFRMIGKKLSPFDILDKEINEIEYPMHLPKRTSMRTHVRNIIKRIIFEKDTLRTEMQYNSKIERISNETEHHSHTNYRWFENK